MLIIKLMSSFLASKVFDAILLIGLIVIFYLIFGFRKNKEIKKYTKDLEDKQRILSALWKIQQIIVQSLEFKEVVQRVANAVLVELGQYGYVIIVLSLIDEKDQVLKRISISETEQARKALQFAPIPFSEIEIPLNAEENFCIKAIQKNKTLSTLHLSDLLTPVIPEDLSDKAQEAAGIKTSIVFPIHSKENSKVIGVLIFSINKDEDEITSYEQEIMRGFVDAVGITVQNAQLYTSLEETKEKLEEANEKLKELDKLKDEFVSLASHELRTPMTAVKSYLWMAMSGRGGPITDKQKVYLDRAYTSTDRLIKLVNDMLNVSRIETGRLTLEPKATDLAQLVSDIVTDVKPRAEELGIEIAQTAPAKLPQVLADGDKIKEVLINLIGNSLKFTPKGGKIEIGVGQNGEMIEIAVADTGHGIAKEDLPKLFQKFGLIDGTYTANHKQDGGTGLGLYICKSIIGLHGGKIWAESQGLGKGAKFTFSLKVFKPQDLTEFEKIQTGKPQTGIIHSPV